MYLDEIIRKKKFINDLHLLRKIFYQSTNEHFVVVVKVI